MLKEARHSAGINQCRVLMPINNTDLHYLSMANLPGSQMPWHYSVQASRSVSLQVLLLPIASVSKSKPA